MAPLLLAAAGVSALVTAGLILRTFGERYRIGRLLATTPRVTIAEANQLAAEGRRAYVRIEGRIDAEAEFEDEHHRPLVFRRVRLESRVGRAWRMFEDHRRTIPFAIQEGLDAIAIDVEALGPGLIVIPRDSVGAAADVADRVPARVPPDTEVRARIDQVSSVEHAIVIGYPEPVDRHSNLRSGDPSDLIARSTPAESLPMSALAMQSTTADPSAVMTSGNGRPLILTVLETDEAMRILAAEGPGRTRAAAILLAAGAALLLGAAAWAGLTALLPAAISLDPRLGAWIATALAASPAPSVAEGGDPRSNGQGPGLVGTPGLAILAVVGIAAVSVLITGAYVRFTGGAGATPTSRHRDGPGAPGSRRKER